MLVVLQPPERILVGAGQYAIQPDWNRPAGLVQLDVTVFTPPGARHTPDWQEGVRH